MRESISSRYDDFIRDLETVVSIDSSSDNLEGVQQVAAFFCERFSRLGLRAEISPHGPAGVPCLSATNRSADQPAEVMLLGHMDTVFPPGEVARRGFSIRDGHAMGPGVCDMKGGLVAVLHTLEALHGQGLLQGLPLQVAFNGDEETGSENSREWILGLAATCRRVLVFEPCRPGYRFVTRRKGAGWFHLECHGKAAHAGADPENGANAVHAMSRLVQTITARADREKGTSINVTQIQGGGKLNIIPDHARIGVDVRIAQTAEMEAVNGFFASLAEQEPLPGVRVSVEGRLDRGPMEPGEKTRQLWALLEKEAGSLGIEPQAIATGGGSDGNFTANMGLPTIDGMGPIGANSHTEEEYLELASITPIVSLAAGLLQRLRP